MFHYRRPAARALLTAFSTLAAVSALTTFESAPAFAQEHHDTDTHHAHQNADPTVGEPGHAGHVNRTIQIEASDSMRFIPSYLEVRQGETIRFVIHNTGKVRHEFSLGSHAALMEHQAMMMQNPAMVHQEAGKVTLDPGARGEVLWHFSGAGTVEFACQMPGHWAAGMHGDVEVRQ